MAEPILSVTDLEGDTHYMINVGLLEAPLFNSSDNTVIIDLNAGWSMFSFPIDVLNLTSDLWDTVNYPYPVTMSSILKQYLYKSVEGQEDVPVYSNPQEYLENVIIVKNNFGLAYLPQWNFDGLGAEMEYNGTTVQFQGFQIKLGSPNYYIKLSGPYYEPTTVTTQSFQLSNGWNMIGVPFEECTVSAVTYVQDFLDKVVIMKNYIGAAYLPEWNFNGIGNMTVGWGYQLKLQNHDDSNLTVTHKTGGTVIIDDEEVDDNPIIDIVDIIDDIPLISDGNITIKVPGNIIVQVVDGLPIKRILDKKVKLINEYEGFGTGGKSAPSQENIQENIQQNLQETIQKSSGKVTQEAIGPFQEQLNEIMSKFSGKDEPSGYPIQASNYVEWRWLQIKDKKISGDIISLQDNLLNYLRTQVFTFAFVAYNSNRTVIVCNHSFKLIRYNLSKTVAFPLTGDDSTTTNTIEGLVSNEIPIIYFFSGEKYYQCTFTLSSGDMQYAKDKEINVVSMSLADGVLNIKD